MIEITHRQHNQLLTQGMTEDDDYLFIKQLAWKTEHSFGIEDALTFGNPIESSSIIFCNSFGKYYTYTIYRFKNGSQTGDFFNDPDKDAYSIKTGRVVKIKCEEIIPVIVQETKWIKVPVVGMEVAEFN